MAGFGFSLADNTSLREGPDGNLLLSTLPLRILRLNTPLFRLLQHLQEGGELNEYLHRNPGLEEGNVFRLLLSLVSRGYLKLDKIADIEDYPKVTVIIPVRNQPGDLQECLQSLARLDYPQDKIEVIVVDDGSDTAVSDIVPSSIKVIRMDRSYGPAACRNTGAAQTNAEILAFLDADCIAGENWLRELVPFFRSAQTGAVGGYIAGYYRDKALDRYEDVSSSLNMGKRLLLEGDTGSSFYVPTANMLVSREAFLATGGFQADRRVGEDVDFCWRLRKLGYTLLYVPSGMVAHKHRNQLGRMLQRRSEYGTSEAALYRAHGEKRKTFLISPYAGLSFLALVLAILLVNPYPLAFILLAFVIDLFLKYRTLRKYNMVLPLRQKDYATLRSHLSGYYFALFHLLRYYLVLITGLGFLWHPLWYLAALAIILTSSVDYSVKKPKLNYPVFLFFYLLEHLAYQAGVFWGCLKLRYFGSYLLSFRRV